MLSTFDTVLGLSLKSEQLGFGHMAARAFIMYLALIVILRSGKKRFFGRATAFDVILVILVGSVAARAMTGGAPYFASLLGVIVLVGMHWLFSLMSRSSKTVSALIKGHSTILVRDGHVDHRELRTAHMSDDDLAEDLRQEGVADVTAVKEARLERSGQVSVIKK
jgi:uncharacterized membrane protein YcaP (DUF421 family)